MNVAAALGAILIINGVFLEAERRQVTVFSIGAALLLIYALWIGNKIFSVAMGGFLLASLIELVEIMTGRHEHSEAQQNDYKNPRGKKDNLNR